jgi:uncharacterized protein YbjT (DUF2867 family)
MRAVIAGGHGKVALALERLLAGRGDQAVGLIRNPAQTADVQQAGAAQQAGVRRFVRVSSKGAGSPPQPGRDEVWAAYITAKTAAEADLRSRDLDWTIPRPGHLTDDPAAGRVRPAAPPVSAGAVSRTDVAAAIAALLHEPDTSHQILELVGGDTPVAEAVHGIS